MMLSLLIVLLVSVVLSVAVPAAPGAAVNLRIEGSNHTIFESRVFTRGHNVTTASGGNHICDGTNLGANLHPGPTATSALSDGARIGHFTFDGTFDTTFDDFFITRIGPDTQTATQFWGLLLNFQFTPVGGCQQQVQNNDEVLWAFDAFDQTAFLKLAGPSVVHRNQVATLTVVDGSTGTSVSGASVGGQVTNSAGQASVRLGQFGVHDFKAEKAGSLRSNRVSITVL